MQRDKKEESQVMLNGLTHLLKNIIILIHTEENINRGVSYPEKGNIYWNVRRLRRHFRNLFLNVHYTNCEFV